MRVLLAPHVSEKANLCTEQNNTVVFKVLRDAEKHEIKTAAAIGRERKPIGVAPAADAAVR